MSPRMKSILKRWNKYLSAQPEWKRPRHTVKKSHEVYHPVFKSDPVDNRAEYAVDRVSGRRKMMTRTGRTLAEALGAY